MNKPKLLLITRLLLILFGITAILVAVFAYDLGLDDNVGMGLKRRVLLIIGIFLSFVQPASYVIRQAWYKITHTTHFQHFIEKINAWLLSRKIISPRKELVASRKKGCISRHSWLWAIAVSVITMFVGFWYLTAGTFHLFTPYFSYYDRQADAFLAGQLHLLEEPAQELAYLPNAYDEKQREGIDYLWDVSYYNGKYYLYWGPVPALVAAAIKLIKPMVVEDQLLVFLFFSGLAITIAAFLHLIRKSWFPNSPGWTVFLFTITISLCTPVFFLVNRPRVYEAAIISAQFFLILGLYGLVRGFSTHKSNNGWFFLAGIGLGASVGSRFTYLIPVLFISIFVLVMLVRNQGFSKYKWNSLIAYAIPLVAMGIGLAWFNFARYGDIFESGLRYQLTGQIMPQDFNDIFSIAYFLPNSYLSLFRPFTILPDQFPFFFVPWMKYEMWPSQIPLPANYFYGEPVVGNLSSIPLLWVLLIPIVNLIRKVDAWLKDKSKNESGIQNNRSPYWLMLLLVGSAALLFFTQMFYVMATMRFLVDFTPLMIIIAILVTWKSIEQLQNHPIRNAFFIIIVTILCMMTIIMGLLFNTYSGGDLRFATHNPELFNLLSRIFGGN